MLRYICVHTLPRGVFEDYTPYRDQTHPGARKTGPTSRPEGYRHWVPGRNNQPTGLQGSTRASATDLKGFAMIYRDPRVQSAPGGARP